MLQAARAALEFLGPAKLEEYLRNEMLQSAIERKIEIIGEASRRVSKAFQLAHPEIPWKSIISQRNVVIHDYGEIKPERIWGVVKTHLPELVAKLEPLLPPLPPELNFHEATAVYKAGPLKKVKAGRSKPKRGKRKY
jgi:uncharacterized protein with HEPN domain